MEKKQQMFTFFYVVDWTSRKNCYFMKLIIIFSNIKPDEEQPGTTQLEGVPDIGNQKKK